jgi:Fe-S cluster assembly protein SufD
MMRDLLKDDPETLLAQLPGDAAARTRRREALASFQRAGFPTRRQENWRYTDLKPIETGEFALAQHPPTKDAISRIRQLLRRSAVDLGGSRIVFVDGFHAAELSAPSESAGLEVRNLETCWDALEARKRPASRSQEHPLAALNAAFVQQGVWIRVAAGARIEAPVHLVFSGSAAARAPQPRVVVDLAAGAELTVVEHFLDAEESTGWINVVTELSQDADSKLTLYRLQEHSAGYLHTGLIEGDVSRDAALTVGTVDLGGRLVRTDTDVSLSSPGASVTLFGLFLASNGQHVDNHTRIDHVAPSTRSDEAFRGIVGERGRGVFNGKVVVEPGAQRVDAKQTSDNLLLSERAEIDTKPELEIYADDVKCSHGATVGEIDAEQLFYLRSRGIEQNTARGLLTFAFANKIVGRLAPAELRERVTMRVAGQLPDHELWGALT